MPSPSPSTARPQARLGSWAVLWACAVVVALAAAALVGVATRHGSAVSPDSATYIAGARNLVAGTGYSDFALVPITDWPPGLSLTLAGLHWTGTGALTAARWLNVAALAAVVLLTFALARRYLSRGWLALAAAMIAGFAPAMLGVFAFIWSEPVFCALCLGVLLVVEPIARSPRASWWLIVAAGVLAGAGFAYRYAGITLVLLAAIVVAVGAWGTGSARVLGRAGAVLAIGLAVPALIVGRNLTHGSLTGQRVPSSQTLHGALDSSEHFLAGWLLADHHPGRTVGAILILAVIAVTALGVALRIRAVGPGAPAGRALVPLVVFVVGYAAYIFITEFQTMIDPPNDRICSPMLAPAAILVMVAVDALLHRCPARIAVAGTGAAAVVIGVWIAAMFVVSAAHARAYGRDGVRFTADGVTVGRWTDSAFMRAVRALPAGSVLSSNQPGGVYLATGRQPIAYSGQPTAYPPIPVDRQTSTLISKIIAARGPVYLVWSLPNYRPHLVTPQDLAARGARLVPVLVTARGIIDRVGG
jgi:hypothetical protein